MSAIRQEIYDAAELELLELQTEIAAGQLRQKTRQRRAYAMIAGGVLLSSLMSALAAQAFMPGLGRPLSVTEYEALRSLMTYVAYKTQAEETWVQEALLAHFNATSMSELEAQHYDAAVEYLLRLVG